VNGGRRLFKMLEGVNYVGEVQKGDVMDGPRKQSCGEDGAILHGICIIDCDVW